MTLAKQDLRPSNQMAPQQLLIKQLLFAPTRYQPETEIVYADEARLTYRDLRRRVQKLAHVLTDLHITHEDTVAVMDWDSHRYLECFFAIPMLGAVLQTINIRLAPEQILYTLNHTGAKVAIVNTEFLPVLHEIAPELTSLEAVILIPEVGTGHPCPFPVAGLYEDLLGTAPDTFDFEEFSEETRATSFHTTGTTGLPKAVYFSHRQLVLHTLTSIATFATRPNGGLEQSDVYMPITPMFHVHAWGLPYVATMLGLKQVYPGRYIPKKLLELKTREGATFSHCVPTILKMLIDEPSRPEHDLNGWKMAIGGTPLTRSLAQEALDCGIDVFCGFGMSETCPLCMIAHTDPSVESDDFDALDQRISAGKPATFVEVRIVDGNMNDVPFDGHSKGELVARAPWFTRGYLGNETTTDALWRGGFLHTDDVATGYPNGFVRIVDRLKDVIKTGGEWVSSIEIEDKLVRHPAVNEAAVFGVPDEKWDERPIAVVVLKDGQSVEEQALKEHLNSFVRGGQLSKYSVPNSVIFIDEIPKTSVGKIDKKKLRTSISSARPISCIR